MWLTSNEQTLYVEAPRLRVRRCPPADAVQPAPRTRFARPTAMKRPASTEVNTQTGELSRQEQAACSPTRGDGACIADERTFVPAEVRGAAQRPVVDVFSFSPFAYRVQGSTEPTGALCPHRRPSGRGAQESTACLCAGCALSAKATPEAKRGGEAPLRVVGVVRTRSTLSQPGQQVTKRLSWQHERQRSAGALGSTTVRPYRHRRALYRP